MTTGNDIVGAALRIVSSSTPGEAIVGDEAANALAVLNRLMQAFSMEWGLINATTVEQFSLIVGQTSYTIGTGGNFNTVRPDTIVNQWLYDTVAGIRYAIDMISDNEYNAITLNTIQAIPQQIYYDAQYPLGVIYIYPTAGLSTYQLNIESIKPIMQFTTLNTVMNLPNEYYETLVVLLADELAPEYGFEIAQGSRLDQKITRARDLMKARNFRRTVATFDFGIGGRRDGNILDGWPGIR